MDGEGPPTEEQMAVFLVRHCNCTPSEAIDELRNNPHVMSIVRTMNYESAYHTVHEWDSLSMDEKKKRTVRGKAPGGALIELAERNRRVALEAKFSEADS